MLQLPLNVTLSELISCYSPRNRHTIKPGMPEHGTMGPEIPAEKRNTPEQWRNNETPAEHSGIPMEQQLIPEHRPKIRRHTKQRTTAMVSNKI